MSARHPGRSIPCPFCTRLFANTTDLHQHIQSKRRVSEAHGLRAEAAPRVRDEGKPIQQEARP